LSERTGFRDLVEQIPLVTKDAREKRLKLEPSSEMSSHLPPGSDRLRVIDLYRITGRLCEQMRVATPVHGDEPSGGLFHRFTHGEQPVIPQNRRLVWAKSFSDPLSLGSFVHHTCEVREQAMVFVKRAGVLRDGIKQPPE